MSFMTKSLRNSVASSKSRQMKIFSGRQSRKHGTRSQSTKSSSNPSALLPKIVSASRSSRSSGEVRSSLVQLLAKLNLNSARKHNYVIYIVNGTTFVHISMVGGGGGGAGGYYVNTNHGTITLTVPAR